ncbi:MAG TPA: sulfite exporter TauE/SafE family protein [Pyrinomonadaceae bacterium]|nr:sulfite exporter TauE/SafE family protein [Pyrinomonadaceae bacterium]
MTLWELIALCVLFFVTSVVGVVTGSNSLITVPAMFLFGIDARVAVATNMFGLTFMSVGGALPFWGKGSVDRARLPRLVALTLVGSAAGALLVLLLPSRAMQGVVSAAMLGVALFSVTTRRPAETEKLPPSRAHELAGLAATFALGVYGGFYSGGYVTILTAAFVALFRMTFVESVATTKVVNVFSSLVATLVFMWHGLVDYKLGMMLAVVMFAGAFVGARVALRLDERWLRRVFLSTVVALALKILLYDFLWKGITR